MDTNLYQIGLQKLAIHLGWQYSYEISYEIFLRQVICELDYTTYNQIHYSIKYHLGLPIYTDNDSLEFQEVGENKEMYHTWLDETLSSFCS